ncbi:MAG: SLBB domain-containing protein [Bacteroidetes bacterium]|nr:SLBB domain-containing protein [Bacteroidota bacterium]
MDSFLSATRPLPRLRRRCIPAVRSVSPEALPGDRTSMQLLLCILVLMTMALSLQAQDAGALRSGDEERGKPDRQTAGSDMLSVVEVPVNDSTYIVGPGDKLSVSIFGTSFYSYVVPVASDGTVVIPGFGTVYVRHATLLQVREKIHDLLRDEVRSAEIIVSLAEARRVKVTVAGAVQEAGIVTLPATARVSEALAAAGGVIEDTTSLRNIRIRRGNGVDDTADLLRYFRIGDLDANPFVSGGDRIFVPPINRTISVYGAVGREGRMDYVEGERLNELIEVCQGILASAFLDSVEVVRFREDNVTTDRFFLDLRGYPDNQDVNIVMFPGDLVLIRSIPRFQRHRLVLVTGEVRHQGSYAIEEGKTRLSGLIARAGNFTDNASLEEAAVIRKPPESEKDIEFERLQKIPAADMREDEYEYFKARSREKVGMMVIDFKRLFLEGDSSQDIYMRDGDVVEIPKLKNYVRIIGRVNTPGNVIYNPVWNFMQYIDAAGGFGWRADKGDVRVVKARTGELVKAKNTGDYQLEPGDTIWVPEVPELKFWEIALTTLGVISQVAGIVGIVIAISNMN